MDWMIYGANGYTGELIARVAVARGLRPILAGRSEKPVEELARALNLQYRIFSCEDPQEIAKSLQDISLVLHCAGPFVRTYRPMIQACLESQTHYLDVTGEILVFENLLRRSKEFKQAGIVVMPGVGFDVYPTDCLAASLKKELPDATHLRLGFQSLGPVGPGSLITMLQGFYVRCAIREDGEIRLIPPGSKVRSIAFQDKKVLAMAIPWGDVSTAYHSTKIPNIEVYIPATRLKVLLMRFIGWLSPGLLGSIGNFLEGLIRKQVSGPKGSVLEEKGAFLYGEVLNAAGKRVEKKYKCPNVYSVTVDAALICVNDVLQGKVEPGAWTPSKALGDNALQRLKGLEPLHR
ncbi:hypothetical protein HOF92_13250 [bacterium]|jgi:short subunit dehydrogenase-like uncharacterized protein|nr:hypothetical protein [bacterium]